MKGDADDDTAEEVDENAFDNAVEVAVEVAGEVAAEIKVEDTIGKAVPVTIAFEPTNSVVVGSENSLVVSKSSRPLVVSTTVALVRNGSTDVGV